MRKIRVSFVIPSFRQGRFIGRTLDALLEQGLPRDAYEVIVMDGGSDDGTIGILRTHPVAPDWVSAPDKGQADAINRGLAKARGDIVAWINSDDYHLPGALRTVLAAFDEPDCSPVVYGRAHVVDAEGHFVSEYPVKPWDYAALADDCFLCQPAVFFRRRLVAEFGPLDADLHFAMDYEYWLRLGAKVPFRFLDRPLAASRAYPETKSLRDKPGVFLDGLKVSMRHTGRPSVAWVRGLGYWRAKAACEAAGSVSPFRLGVLTARSRLAIRARLVLGLEP